MTMTIRKAVAFLLVFLVSGITRAELIGVPTYYHNNLVGSPVAASSSSGALLWTTDYLPYGEKYATDSNASSNKVWFTGHVQDAPQNLIYMEARYYDPEVGRFMAIDPVGFTEANPQSFNRYAYANNNPYKYVDPNGREAACLYTGGCNVNVRPEGARLIASFVPVLGDAIGVAEAYEQPTLINIISAGIGLVPLVGDGASKLLKATKSADEYVDLATAQRRAHILDGDATGGGHGAGRGVSGKSEFPSGWSDDRVMHEISDVATDPNSVRTHGRGGRTVVEGTRDGVGIRVILGRDGEIITGFPTNVGRNP